VLVAIQGSADSAADLNIPTEEEEEVITIRRRNNNNQKK